LKQIVRFSKTKENFIEICSDDRIAQVLVKGNEWSLFYIFRLLSDKEELFELLKNPDFIYFLTKCKEDNIEFILDYLDINSAISLKALFED